MKPQPARLLRVVAATLAVVLISTAGQVSLEEPTTRAPNKQAAPLIDWNTYTSLFNKSYSSWRQATVRQNLFTAKEVQVFLTAAKFKLNALDYYMVINQYSDLTPEEERAKMSGEASGDRDSGHPDDEDAPMDDEQVKRLLEAELEEDQKRAAATAAAAGGAGLDKKKPSAARLAAARKRRQLALQQQQQHLNKRSKRSTEDGNSEPKRTSNGELSLSDLVQIPDQNGDQALSAAPNLKWVVPSNNPDYQPMEQMSMGETAAVSDTEKLPDVPEEQIERIEASASGWASVPLPRVIHFLSDSAKSTFNWVRSKSFKWTNGGQSDDEPAAPTKSEAYLTRPAAPRGSGPSTLATPTMAAPAVKKSSTDVVIKDWRDSGCISPPIQQGSCQSCYAVSAIAHLEWSFCMHQERTLTPLSIQYLVSCGPQMRAESDPKMNLQLFGCDRGRSWQTMYFIKEYGAELAAHMPYLARDSMCPVEPGTPLKSKGYIRPNVKQQVRMQAKTTQLDLALKVGPVIVNFREPRDFFAYGGGMVGRCYQRGGHAMLVVGHGIENDKPYLIIKNSFGTNWGMRGYFKFDRKYTEECIKDFILPRFSFPSKKSQARHVKAYLAERVPATGQENMAPNLDKMFDDSAGGLLA